MPTRSGARALCFLVPVLLTACLSLAGCTSHQVAARAAQVSPAGGVVTVSPGVRIQVAAGTRPGTTVDDRDVPDAPAYPGGLAVPVGPAVDISPSGPLAAATVQLGFDPATDLPHATPGNAAPTTGNAFIAVLDQSTRTWVPLPTTYDAAARQLTAVAPHFSVFRKYVLMPGSHVVHTAAAAVSVVVKAGESGLRAAQAVGDAVWDDVKPEYGAGFRRSLPEGERIDGTCSGTDPQLPWDQGYAIYVNDENMQVRSCVVDAGADPGQPALLMENDYGFPVDVIPQEKGAGLPALSLTAHPDQDAVAALDSLRGYGYIPGPGVTQIKLPSGEPPVFYVDVQADWLGLATDVIMTAASIIPGYEAETSTFSSQLENVITTEEKDGQVAESQTQVLKIVQTKLKAEKGSAFEGGDHLAAAYSCMADLESVSLTDSVSGLAGKMTDCLKELLPKPGDAVAVAGGVVSEYLGYLNALAGYIQLPEVLNDFREHGRQVFIVDAVKKPAPASLADGTYYGFVDSLDTATREITFDKTEFYQDPTPQDGEATRLCEKNGVPVQPEEELCHDYYLKDDHVTESAAISPSAAISSYQEPGGPASPGASYQLSLAQLGQLVTASGNAMLLKFTVADGQVTAISGVWMP
jgi:hypothetical protein